MRNFHLTRIAVTLLLIVALAIQPVAVCLANVECAEGCSDPVTLTCQGCGCCEVERADDRCCCCGGTTDEVEVETTEPSCCSSKHQDSGASDSFNDADETSATAIAPIESGFRSICLCEQDSQPLSDSSPRRPSSEHRDTFSLATSDIEDSVWGCDHLLAASQYATSVPPTHRFSQVMLCIWRL